MEEPKTSRPTLRRKVVGPRLIGRWQMPTVAEAIGYIQGYRDAGGTEESVLKYEIYARYNTGDGIQGIFNHKEDAIRFLKNFA